MDESKLGGWVDVDYSREPTEVGLGGHCDTQTDVLSDCTGSLIDLQNLIP